MTSHCPECGYVLEDAKPVPRGKPRSYPQLKRFFAIIAAAFEQWRHDHEFRPRNKDHLRYWLEVQAGHFTVDKTIKINNADPDVIFEVLSAVMSVNEDHKQFIDVDCDLITVKRVHSIAYEKLPHESACALFNEVDAVLAAEGFDPEQLLRERGKAA